MHRTLGHCSTIWSIFTWTMFCNILRLKDIQLNQNLPRWMLKVGRRELLCVRWLLQNKILASSLECIMDKATWWVISPQNWCLVALSYYSLVELFRAISHFKGATGLLGICKRVYQWHFLYLWDDARIDSHFFQLGFNISSCFYGQPASSMLHWGKNLVYQNWIFSGYITDSVEWVRSSIIEGLNLMWLVFSLKICLGRGYCSGWRQQVLASSGLR